MRVLAPDAVICERHERVEILTVMPNGVRIGWPLSLATMRSPRDTPEMLRASCRRHCLERHCAVLFGFAVLIVAVLAACTSARKSCGAVGACSGVSASLDRGLLSTPTPVTLTACVDRVCQTQTYDQASPPLFVALSPIKNGVW